MERQSFCYFYSLILSVSLCSSAVLAEGWTKTYLLKCLCDSVKELSERGEIKDVSSLSGWKKTYSFTIDLTSGMFRSGSNRSSEGEQLNVLQVGDAKNDTVVSLFNDQDAFKDFIRIRDWSSNNGEPITFLRIHYSTIVSGTCEKVQ
jgi:hypothetical protein